MTTNPTTVPDFTISKLTILDGEPNPRGHRLLAAFHLDLPIVEVRGCVLIEKATGVVVAHGPTGKTSRGHTASTAITDAALARAITRRAAAAYSGLTGREVSDE